MSDTNTNEQPKWVNKSATDTQLGVNEGGDGWVYPSAASTGFVEVEIPALEGSVTPSETLLIRDFGQHVITKIERSMNKGYMRSGPQADPVATLRHYVACAKGCDLMEGDALKRLESLASEFEKEPLRQEYFEMVIQPYLHSLVPRRR